MKKIIILTIATLAAAAGCCNAAEPMAKYRELVLKIDEFRQQDAASGKFLLGKQGSFERNLKQNGWKESTLPNNYSMLGNALGKINKKYILSHYIIIDDELRESDMTASGVILASGMLEVANLASAMASAPESQDSIETRSKLRKISSRLYQSSRYTVAVGLSEGARQGNFATVRSEDDASVPTLSANIMDTVLDTLKMALEMAGRASANSVTNYSKTLSGITFKVSSDGTSRVYIAVKDSNAPNGHFELTMDEVRSVVALLEAAKSNLENIMQTSKAEAREHAAHQIRNERIFEDDKNNTGASSKSGALPELKDATIQSYFKATPNMDSNILDQAKELFANNDYAQSMALCDILLKNSPHDDELKQFKESIASAASAERNNQVKALLNAKKYEQALAYCETLLRNSPHDDELRQLKKSTAGNVLNQAKELFANNDYDQAMALCDILLKNNPYDYKTQQFKESIASAKRSNRIKKVFGKQ
jgi:tetratricopeptide (TPR) repeat protein